MQLERGTWKLWAVHSGQHSGDLGREVFHKAGGFLPWSACVPDLHFCSLRACSIARTSFLMCGHVGRQFVESCCYHTHSETHTEIEAVNLSLGLPVGINYSSGAVARMAHVFLWELCLASAGV